MNRGRRGRRSSEEPPIKGAHLRPPVHGKSGARHVGGAGAAADPHKQALLNVLGLITKVVELWPTGVIKQTNWSEIGGELRRGGRPDLADLVEQTMACVQAPSTGPAHVPADLASVSTTMSSVSTNEALLARVIALSHSSTNTQAPLEQLAESAEFTVYVVVLGAHPFGPTVAGAACVPRR